MYAELYDLGLVVLAAGFGAIIGMEREFADKPAGLKTHMFVCAASAMLMLLGNSVLNRFQQEEGLRAVTTDPIRTIQAIVLGISFLGAGTIVHHGEDRVEGLTTAASILLTAGIGIAVAVGQFVLAAGTAGLGVIVLIGVGLIEKRLPKQTNS
jgi:putative Mg2+ transporter-C (MgtC) family protein